MAWQCDGGFYEELRKSLREPLHGPASVHSEDKEGGRLVSFFLEGSGFESRLDRGAFFWALLFSFMFVS